MRSKVSSLAVFLVMLGTCISSRAQIFRVQGGTSTLFGASGGSVDIKAQGYQSTVGIGVLDGHFQYGFLVRTKVFGDVLSVGDDTVKVDLPTDVFDASHYFLSRGVGLQHVDEKSKSAWYAFAGTTTEGFSTPFFIASRSQTGLGIIHYERQLNGKLRFTSRNLFSDKQTSIQAVEYAVAPGVKIAGSAGIGTNQPYMAASASVDRENFILRAAYIAEGMNFQRMQVPSPLSTEPEKANIAAAYRINRFMSVRGSHQNILQPANETQPTLTATTDEAYTDFSVARFNVGAGFVDSRTSGRTNLGINVYASRNINRMISVTGNYYQSRPDVGENSNTLTAAVREQVTQRLALTQTLIRSNGQNTVAFGGEFVGNRLSAFVGYQTVYVPFNPNNAFQQAMNFNVSVNLPRNMRLTAGSFVDPQGKVRYTVGLGTYLYRLRGMAGAAPSAQTFKFAKLVSEGIVLDVNGQPIEGVAVHVDGKVAYTDSEGHFMMRLDRVGPHAVSVAMDEFIAPGVWEVVESPTSTMAQREGEGVPMKIVLRRVPARKPAAPINQ